MTDISEAQTIEYFVNGIRKAKSAARELAKFNSSNSWVQIRATLGQIEKNARKMYTDKPQTRLQTLSLAESISKTVN